MKLFALYGQVDLMKKPDWLDAFRVEFDEPYEYHITFKQPCFIPDEDIPEIKERYRIFFNSVVVPEHRIPVVYRSWSVGQTTHGSCLMVAAQPNPLLEKIQKGIVQIGSTYLDFCKPGSEQWERDFKPHLTIARHLDAQRLSQAVERLREKGVFTCEAVISQVYLSVVMNDTVEEANKPQNHTIFAL